jgi:hypothetical protein
MIVSVSASKNENLRAAKAVEDWQEKCLDRGLREPVLA